jgi:hypothetical protein
MNQNDLALQLRSSIAERDEELALEFSAYLGLGR